MAVKDGHKYRPWKYVLVQTFYSFHVISCHCYTCVHVLHVNANNHICMQAYMMDLLHNEKLCAMESMWGWTD